MQNLPKLEVKLSNTGVQDADVLAVYQDQAGKNKKPIPPRGVYGDVVERFGKASADGAAFSGAHGSVQYIRFGGKGGAQNLLLAGFGAASELTLEKLRVAGGNAWTKLKAEKDRSVVVEADAFIQVKGLSSDLTHSAMVRAFAEGLLLGAYEFTKHKSGKAKEGSKAPTKFTFVTKEKGLVAQLARELPKVEAAAEAMRVARDWSNEPSNIGTPEYFAGEAKKFARKYGLKCRVLSERECAREKMGLFLGVGQGAEREGCVVVLEYAPKGVSKKNLKTLALVGKGITFDTGGISIKPSANMENMKHDMTGASTVMGAILLAAAWKVPNRVIAVMGFTENMPDGNAIQPGNVLVSRAGKTVEVNNTDAEGRLILADILDYAQDMKPDAVIDVATLTGAVSIALGKLCCGVMGNDDLLVENLRRAADANGERIWQLPLWDEYFDDLKSETADMRNVGSDSYGGTIRGAAFLKQFIRKGVPWAHMDIASMAAGISHLSYYPKKGASGAFVRTLARFAADF